MSDMLAKSSARIIAIIICIIAATTAIFGGGASLVLEGYYAYETSASATADCYAEEYPSGYLDYSINGYHADEFTATVYNLCFPLRFALPILSGISFLLALSAFIFLMFASGRQLRPTAQSESAPQIYVRAGTLERIPLEILLAVLSFLTIGSIRLAVEIPELNFPLAISILIVMCICLLLIWLLFFCSCSIRFKLGGWWKTTLIYLILRLVWKIVLFGCRLIKKLFIMLGALSSQLPILGKIAILFGGFTLVNTILVLLMFDSEEMLFFWILFTLSVLIILTICALRLRELQQAAHRMAQGDMDSPIDVSNWHGSLRIYGENLNSIASGMNKAVEARLKSEHMKTELITNVSHDLKTPLTSIINYIDLLKKEQLDNPKADEYLEVLERQSARLKKLTEDVLEASKASTGNINIKLEPIDISELLTQAVGEYEERFAQSNLKPIICKPDYPCLAMADGALLWRVFDNLLSNICKYSQQHTRIFISLDESAHYFTVSLKNTSHDLLNISPDELMERFVRGDSSRNSEGSGLGLSIAQSLTALQNGTLSLDVDGDLFKTFIRLERYLQPYPAESDEQNI